MRARLRLPLLVHARHVLVQVPLLFERPSALLALERLRRRSPALGNCGRSAHAAAHAGGHRPARGATRSPPARAPRAHDGVLLVEKKRNVHHVSLDLVLLRLLLCELRRWAFDRWELRLGLFWSVVGCLTHCRARQSQQRSADISVRIAVTAVRAVRMPTTPGDEGGRAWETQDALGASFAPETSACGGGLSVAADSNGARRRAYQ